MIVTKKTISRRAVLRGIGTAVALPLLDAMAPALTAAKTRRRKQCAVSASFTIQTASSTISGCQRAPAPSWSSRPCSRRWRRSATRWSSSRDSTAIKRKRWAMAAETTRAPQGRT